MRGCEEHQSFEGSEDEWLDSGSVNEFGAAVASVALLPNNNP